MTLDEIRATIEQNIPGAQAHVLDPLNDGEHLQAFVISPLFATVPLVQQHKMVMNPLRDAFARSVHALALKTFTPEAWEKKRQQYGF